MLMPFQRGSGISLKIARKRGYRVKPQVKLYTINMCESTNLPKSAFLSAEEKVQLLSGSCPRNITKARLIEWLSYRKGTSKDGSAKSDATKAELVIRYEKYVN
jgi:hypothetical protein